jgi:putative transposase
MADRCRSFRFLLQPTTKQRAALQRLVDGQRELYNAGLEERRGAWRWERRSVTRYDQYRTLTGLRDVRPDTLAFGVTVCRGTLARLDEAFKGFFRRLKRGERPGFPRFQGKGRFDSVSWPDVSGWKLQESQRRLYLQGIGQVKYRPNRPLRGVAKTITVRREGRRWFLTVFCVEVPAQPLPATGQSVGMDVGVASLVTLSDATVIANLRPGRRVSGRLAAAQRDHATKKRGSIRGHRAAERIGALHRKIANQRRDHLHKASRLIVERYDFIVHEDLRITNMTRRPAPRPDDEGGYHPNGASAKSGLNRSILDAGWGTLLSMIAYKAENAGRQVMAVDARHSSQRCSACGHTEAANRVSQAEFRCRACGHEAHADFNAARNILRAGLAQREQSREVHNAA